PCSSSSLDRLACGSPCPETVCCPGCSVACIRASAHLRRLLGSQVLLSEFRREFWTLELLPISPISARCSPSYWCRLASSYSSIAIQAATAVSVLRAASWPQCLASSFACC